MKKRVSSRAMPIAVWLLGLWGACSVWARVHSVSADEKVYRIIDRHQNVLIYFYHKECGSGCHRESSKQVQRMLGQLSERWEYKEGELQFLRARVADDRMRSFIAKACVTSLPAFVLFQDGRVLQYENGGVATLDGCADYEALKDFIDDAIGDDLADVRADKQEERERQRELRAYYWATSWPCYAGWGCGYPYGGYWGGYGGWGGCGGCYGGGYVGFGFCR